jgi:hypothetical protein
MPHALTEITTLPGPAVGDGTSSSTSVSTGPNSLHKTAFMHPSRKFLCHGQPESRKPDEWPRQAGSAEVRTGLRNFTAIFLRFAPKNP